MIAEISALGKKSLGHSSQALREAAALYFQKPGRFQSFGFTLSLHAMHWVVVLDTFYFHP